MLTGNTTARKKPLKCENAPAPSLAEGPRARCRPHMALRDDAMNLRPLSSEPDIAAQQAATLSPRHTMR
jgi:hypothetical protein